MRKPLPSKTHRRQATHEFGLRAEKWAAWFLRLKGYRIVAERYRNRAGEIDLLATKGRVLAVIEVKARADFSQCADAVPPMKQQKIMRTLEGLMASSSKIAGLAGAQERDIRFDVVWVVRKRIPRHMKDAWRP